MENEKCVAKVYSVENRCFFYVPYEFRKEPVPGISHNHASRKGAAYRHMKTTSELRRNGADVVEGVYVRKSRNKRNLPNAYWDFVRSDHYHNSWKSCTKRKKQYKV